jgi:uncharacterized membrane protein YdbT with pleckstrin-like domain/CRP-like cAMP-binding protein
MIPVTVDTAQIVALLKRTYLFYGVPDGLLQQIAEQFQGFSVEQNEVVYRVNDDPEFFYLIYRGKVAVTPRNERKPYAWLVRGDFFGYEAIIKRRLQREQVIAQAGTVLLRLKKEDFMLLYQSSQHFKKCIQQRLQSDVLARRLKFDWRREAETIYLLATKHVFFLWQALVGPFVGLVFAAVLVLLFVMTDSAIPLLGGIILAVASLLWGIWQAIDWGNDYYIITNERIVWIEKVLFLYDSRVESPFNMIKNADANTDLLGRLLNYGDVTIKTYTTKIVFEHIPSPYQVNALLQDMLGRTAEQQKKAEEETMTRAIMRELGLLEEPKKPPKTEPEMPPVQRLSMPLLVLSSLFQLRTVQGDAIVYRKHWFILLQQAWRPTLAMLFLLALGLANLLFNTPENNMWAYFAIILFFFLIALGWWIWEFVDWSNDRFELTPTQIIDVDKKPLGDENRKTAKLEDILSIEYQREGIIGLLLNFGTVFIRVGTETFTFDHVSNPSVVQQEIEQRRQERLSQNRENEIKGERERMAKWMAIYHKSAQEIAELEEKKRRQEP